MEATSLLCSSVYMLGGNTTGGILTSFEYAYCQVLLYVLCACLSRSSDLFFTSQCLRLVHELSNESIMLLAHFHC
jgi:hypothetical protein